MVAFWQVGQRGRAAPTYWTATRTRRSAPKGAPPLTPRGERASLVRGWRDTPPGRGGAP